MLSSLDTTLIILITILPIKRKRMLTWIPAVLGSDMALGSSPPSAHLPQPLATSQPLSPQRVNHSASFAPFSPPYTRSSEMKERSGDFVYFLINLGGGEGGYGGTER